MLYKILMKRNFPSGRMGMPTLYGGIAYRVPEGVSEKIARKAIEAGAAEITERAPPPPTPPEPNVGAELAVEEMPKPEEPKRYPRKKALPGAPENKADAASSYPAKME